jgi:hypothetical protein
MGMRENITGKTCTRQQGKGGDEGDRRAMVQAQVKRNMSRVPTPKGQIINKMQAEPIVMNKQVVSFFFLLREGVPCYA